MAPLAPPPGLESAGAAGAFGGPLGLFGEFPSTSASSTSTVCGGDTPPTVDLALLEAVRQAALKDVEAEVSQRLTAVWKKGAQVVQQVQLEGDNCNAQLAQTVAEFRVAQDAFEVENEKLKQTVAALVGRVSLLGAGAALGASPLSLFGGDAWNLASCSPPPTPSLDSTATAHGSCFPTPASATVGSSGLDEFWGVGAMALAGDNIQAPMADLPPFPFPASPFLPQPQEQAASAAPPAPLNVAPLSLADALGIGCDPSEEPPSHTPTIPKGLSPLTPSFSVPPGTPTSPEEADADGFIFSLSLRLADGAELGLQLLPAGDSAAGTGTLHIERVVPGGAAEAWNRQCGSSGAAEKVLLPNDRIVRVNDVGDDSQAMLRECECKRLLRFQVVRVGGGSAALCSSPAPSAVPATSSPSPATEPSFPSSPSKLRADASEWVPTTASASPPPSPAKFNVAASVFVPRGVLTAGPVAGTGCVSAAGGGGISGAASDAAPAQGKAQATEGSKRSRRAAARAGARARGAREM